MIAGCDNATTPVLTLVALGLANVRLTVVELPILTVVAVTTGVEVVNEDPATPVRPTVVLTPATLVGTDNVAEWLPATVGA
jgi:hypothetical protein